MFISLQKQHQETTEAPIEQSGEVKTREDSSTFGFVCLEDIGRVDPDQAFGLRLWIGLRNEESEFDVRLFFWGALCVSRFGGHLQ